MVFPPIHPFMSLKGKRARLSDIEFLAKKEFDGKLVTNEGTLSVTGDLATLTANTGKDMYIARAKVTFYSNAGSTSASFADQAVLRINGVIVETARFGFVRSGGGDGVLSYDYEFKNIGQKVTATQIIKLEVITLDTETDIEGFIECFEETTGETPVI